MTTPTTAAEWRDRASRLAPETRPFIGGNYRTPEAPETFTTLNPATGAVIAGLPASEAADAGAAVAVARQAFDDGRWSHQGPLARKSVLVRMAEGIEANAADFALLDSLEVGKPISEAIQEVHVAAGFFRYYGEALDKLEGTVAPGDQTTLGMNLYEPIGVVAAIVPWNFPLINAALKTAPALAAGNSVVLKPSEISSLSALKLGEIATCAGLPEGVLNIITGFGPSAGEALVSHPAVDMIAFTGSTAAGKRVMELAAKNGAKRVALECGGKSPQLVFDDGFDWQAAIPAIAHDAYWNQGQVCVSRCRLIIEASLKDQLLDALKTYLAALRPGDPLDPATRFGAIAGERFFNRIMGYLEVAKTEGAKVALGGRAVLEDSGGYFIEPTVLDQVEAGSTVAREEIFGPVLTVQSFRSEAEALALANDTSYGLAATVWTGDLARGIRLGRAVRAGKVKVQSAPPKSEGTAFALASEPVKASGFGAEFGMAGLKTYTSLKAIEFLI